MRFARGAVVVVLPLLYFGALFQVWHWEFWTTGLGEWMDPYFMNGLLEHWYHSARTLADPSSPPMYFPVPKTLAYSHGLVLYAPFYIPLRLLLHPFRAYNATLFLVLVFGSVCLYVVLRRLRLPPLESLLLTALFVTSRNVDNGVGIWIQRASAYFIPPIVLILIASHRMRGRRAGGLLAGLGGLLATLMYVQDFYTAHFTLLLGTLMLIGVVLVGRTGLIGGAASVWRTQPRAARFAFAAAALLAVWAAGVWMSGGVQTRVLGIRFTARGYLRPVVAAALALAVGFVASRDARRRVRAAATPWRLAVTAGAAAGAVFFLWTYLPAYRQHPAFPEDQLWRALGARDPSRWHGPLDVVRALISYPSFRGFGLTLVLAAAAWLPWLRFDARTRALSIWWIAISLFVLLLPLRFNELSIWKASIGWLPGFVSIRDPSRIIQVYDLAAVFVAAWLLTRPAAANRTFRIGAAVLMLLLLARGSYADVFEYQRPIAVYERWVAAPIEVDPSCASFYVKGGSREYMSRSRHMWSLYGLDGLFVALKYNIPTLNGYSAWAPAEWWLQDPQNPGYDVHVRDWIRMHGLRDVCELDLEARTMKPGIR